MSYGGQVHLLGELEGVQSENLVHRSGSPIVIVDQTTKNVATVYFAGVDYRWSDRDVLIQPLMGSGTIVVVNILVQDTSYVRFVEDQQMI